MAQDGHGCDLDHSRAADGVFLNAGIYLFIYLSIYLSIYISIYISIYDIYDIYDIY